MRSFPEPAKIVIGTLVAIGLYLGGAWLSAGQAASPPPTRSEAVTVAPLVTPAQGIRREQLGVEIRRFADRYAARMSLETDRILERARTPELRWFATGWELSSRAAVLDIAIGPNEVENLLDMLVLTTLTRQEAERYWGPKVLGRKLGQGLVRASRQLEAEAWRDASAVLTAKQKEELRAMIKDWSDANPDQHYFWEVRFAGFTGQRAADLRRVQRTGGLLREVRRVRETADEMRAFSERLLYYLQRAPAITRLEAEFGMREMFRSPEVRQLLRNTDQLTKSSETYAEFLNRFPAEREATLKQFMQMERQLLKNLLESKEMAGTVGQLSDEGGEIANVAFVRATVLIVLWFFAYVGGRLSYDYLSAKMAHKKEGKS